MSTLVTGSAGFIGSLLVRELVHRGHEVVGLIHRTPPVSLKDMEDEVNYARCNLESFPEIVGIFKNFTVEYVFHTAAMLSAESESAPPMRSLNTNIVGTMNILEASRLLDTKRIVFTSSASVFGRTRAIEDDSEKYPFNSIYGAEKLFNELSGLWYHQKYGLDFRGVRFPNVYGRGRTTGGDAFCSQFIVKTALGEPAEIPHPEFVTNWLYVKDAVRALIMLFNAKEPKRRVYNIAGEHRSIKEAVKIVKEFIPNANITFTQAEHVIFPKTSFDDIYARREIQWVPAYSLRDGIKDIINETRAQMSKP